MDTREGEPDDGVDCKGVLRWMGEVESSSEGDEEWDDEGMEDEDESKEVAGMW